MENILKKDRLSPYFIGICIGILSWITVYFMHEKNRNDLIEKF